MSARRARAALASVLALLASACAGTPAPLGPIEPLAYDPNDRIDFSATECGAQVLILLPIGTNNRLPRAMDLISERAGDRYIANVRVRERWTPLVFGEIICTDVVAATYGRVEPAASAPAAEVGEAERSSPR